MDRRRLLGCVTLMLALCHIGPWSVARSQGITASVDHMVELFARLTETTVIGQGSRPGVQKWQKPVRFAVVGAPSTTHVERIKAHFALVAQLTQLDIQYLEPDVPDLILYRGDAVPNVKLEIRSNDTDPLTTRLEFSAGGATLRWRGNFLVLFGNRRQVVAYTMAFGPITEAIVPRFESEEIVCYSMTRRSAQSRMISDAVLLIRRDVEDWRIERCIAREATRAFGFLNTVRGIKATLLEEVVDDRRTSLTPVDRLFLGVLYDPRIVPGMRDRALRETARQIIVGWPAR